MSQHVRKKSKTSLDEIIAMEMGINQEMVPLSTSHLSEDLTEDIEISLDSQIEVRTSSYYRNRTLQIFWRSLSTGWGLEYVHWLLIGILMSVWVRFIEIPTGLVATDREKFTHWGNDMGAMVALSPILYGVSGRPFFSFTDYSFRKLIVKVYLPVALMCNYALITIHLGPISNYVLNSKQFDPSDGWHLIVFCLEISFGIYITIRAFNTLTTIRQKCWWLLFFISLFTFFIIRSADEYDDGGIIHIHHYLVGLYTIIMTRGSTNFDLWAQIFGYGLYIDGVTRFGFDSPWSAN